MSAPIFEADVPISVRTTSDGASVAVGVVMNGGFFPFHWFPAGGFADDLATIAQDSGQYYNPDAATTPPVPSPDSPAT